MEKPNFIEHIRLEDANKVDLKEYTFLKLDDYRGYCFKKRSERKAAK
jgi:hypothetical protein